MPVRAFTTAEPPSKSMAVTIMFVKKQKHKNTMCAWNPHLALTISQIVCAPGAFLLISMANTPNNNTCTAEINHTSNTQLQF
jgi:hypothetical protein